LAINYPTGDGTTYMPWFSSIIDANTTWVGTVRQGQNGYMPYARAVKTDNGGLSWQFYPIPVPGTPWIQHIGAWDANICYYVFVDGSAGGGSIWKTTDGGLNWAKKTTTQFLEGWANFIHLFSADTCVAMGDPSDGRFEIQLTYDGGETWTRVPASDMPAALTGENGLSGNYCAVDNTLWFPTSKGRCFRSTDRGLHWTDSTVNPEVYGSNIGFCDTQNGFFYAGGPNTEYYQTTDGGDTWIEKPVKPGQWMGGMCRVPGIYHGMVMAIWPDLAKDSVSVLFSTDFFNTSTVLDSNLSNATGNINFKNSTTGWISGKYLTFPKIYKFTGVISSAQEKKQVPELLEIIPNPASGKTLIRINSADRGLKLKILDMSGKVFTVTGIREFNDHIEMDAGIYPSGNYVLQLLQGDKVVANKVWIVKH
jgi:photosystem II stability/assembly factor-like uncharacterized protein